MNQLGFLLYICPSTAGVAAGDTGGDYVNVVNQTIIISSTSTSFGYQLLSDDIVEGLSETFQLVLSPGAGGPVAVSNTDNVATISIADNSGKQI